MQQFILRTGIKGNVWRTKITCWRISGQTGLWIRIDPDPAFWLNPDPDPDPGSEPSQKGTLKNKIFLNFVKSNLK
jgi:hypothetical protein